MKRVIVGIDIGASLTKVVALEKSRILAMKTVVNADVTNPAQNAIETVLLSAERKSEDVKRIAISGGGARLFGDTFLGFSVTKVDEIKAIGLGGLELSGKQKALIVSMGTGTALVIASDKGRKIEHIGGTGVGGGTIEGLSRRMIGTDRFQDIEEMAIGGRASYVNLTVADIEGGPVGILPKDATASNFKKLSVNTYVNDIAAAIFNMVSEVIGVITVMAAKAYNLEKNIVFVGKLIQSKKIAEQINAVTKMFSIEVFIPTNGEYCVAIGAAKSII